ncbi:MAG: transposase [Candidatus Sumerlaeaceae bacterium]
MELSGRGWYTRGYLPHFDSPEKIQSVTFRLYDAVPQQLLDCWKQELGWKSGLAQTDDRQVELRRRLDKYEDAGYGQCWLRLESVAALVQNSLLFFDLQRYHLLGWTIMPNHVHVAIDPIAGHLLEDIVHSWKSYSALHANRILQGKGKFWFREYYDRYIRDGTHLASILAYIDNNPVKAGLVSTAAEWRFGSAYQNRTRSVS